MVTEGRVPYDSLAERVGLRAPQRSLTVARFPVGDLAGPPIRLGSPTGGCVARAGSASTPPMHHIMPTWRRELLVAAV